MIWVPHVPILGHGNDNISAKQSPYPLLPARRADGCPIHAVILSKAKRSRRTRFLNLRRMGGKTQTSAEEFFDSLFPPVTPAAEPLPHKQPHTPAPSAPSYSSASSRFASTSSIPPCRGKPQAPDQIGRASCRERVSIS